LKHKTLQVPGSATFSKIMFENRARKKSCLSHFDCLGMNVRVYDGVFDHCGKTNPFVIWNKHIDEKKFK
jgi:hypothetical protein